LNALIGDTLYGVFHNGAYGQPGAVEDLSRETIEKQFASNVFGWMELNNLLIPQMRKNDSGRIVFNSSVLGLVSLPFRGAYNASKYAIEGFADTLRLELSDTNIKVCLVEPGPIESRFRPNALHPNPHYYVTKPTYIMGYMKRILPSKFLDKFILAVAGGELK